MLFSNETFMPLERTDLENLSQKRFSNSRSLQPSKGLEFFSRCVALSPPEARGNGFLAPGRFHWLKGKSAVPATKRGNVVWPKPWEPLCILDAEKMSMFHFSLNYSVFWESGAPAF